MISEEVIKNSFQKVKEDIANLKAEITQIKRVLEEIRQELKSLREAPKPKDLASPEEDPNQISIGNQGDSSTIINNHQYTSTINNQSPTMINMKKELENTFKTLTDREFSIFMAIYALDKEGKETNYEGLAKQLNISEHTIRGYLGSLLHKNVPIQKERFLNGKVSLSIKKEFKQLDLYQKLLRLRISSSGQRTLFDI